MSQDHCIKGFPISSATHGRVPPYGFSYNIGSTYLLRRALSLVSSHSYMQATSSLPATMAAIEPFRFDAWTFEPKSVKDKAEPSFYDDK